MKTVQKVEDMEIVRMKDRTAQEAVNSGLWHYVSKKLWKDKTRSKKRRGKDA